MGLGRLLRAQFPQGMGSRPLAKKIPTFFQRGHSGPTDRGRLYLNGRQTGWLEYFFLYPTLIHVDLRLGGFKFIWHEFFLPVGGTLYGQHGLHCFLSCLCYKGICRVFIKLTIIQRFAPLPTNSSEDWVTVVPSGTQGNKPLWVPCPC